MIKLSNFSFQYGENSIIKDADIEIPQGSLTVFLGINGVGKSTLFKCLLKQERVEKGHAFIDGNDIVNLNNKQLSNLIAYVPQMNEMVLSDSYVRDYLVESRTNYLRPFSVPGKKEYLLVNEYAEKMGITHLLSRKLNSLSGGELQLVSITRALSQETPIIIMDEPMSALDIPNQLKILKMIQAINNDQKTILFSTHDPNHALMLKADVCLLRKESTIVYGYCDEVLTKENIQENFSEFTELIETSNGVRCFILDTNQQQSQHEKS